jgi:membrane-associated protein
VTVIFAPVAELLGISWLDPQYLLHHFGDYALWAAALMIFAECGLLVGFFLPGDSLLFTTGLLVGQGAIGYSLWLCCLVLTVAAVAGNASGYLLGLKGGQAIFEGRRPRFMKREYVTKTHDFFERHGNRAIVLGRFVPVVRTFITAMAGVGSMGFRRFLGYSAVGAVAWAAGVTVLGYFLGNVAIIRDHIDTMLVAIVVISLVPIGVGFLRRRPGAQARGPRVSPRPVEGEAHPPSPQRGAGQDPCESGAGQPHHDRASDAEPQQVRGRGVESLPIECDDQQPGTSGRRA